MTKVGNKDYIRRERRALQSRRTGTLDPVVNRHLMAIKRIYGTTLADLSVPCMEPWYVKPRWDLWFRLVIVEGSKDPKDGYSLPKAGRVTGNHDHTTVLCGVRKFGARHYGTDPKASLDAIRAAYNAFCGEMAA